MFSNSRIDIYDYIAEKMRTVTPNIYPMGVPTENTESDVDSGFVVLRVGSLNDKSEFDCEAYGWARCYVTAYIPKKKRGRLNKELYKSFEDGINNVIRAEQEANGNYYIAKDSVISMDDDETSLQGNQYYLFVKSFVVVVNA